MPCWYFEKKEIRNSPSYQDGIDQATENRYRREGARLILDAGTKLGLRYDTCATGVVYFHRFYMFHCFRDFHRYVMGACCLFLAGKVEETPKKCKDIIRTAQTLLTTEQFAPFGDDPREEVMTMERILLQTIKFDLQVEHPYGFLLNFAKQIKGDKEKIQKMTQMSWTFINDSLCTTLCLQWEPEIVAVSLMYLASRLTKFDPVDWVGRLSGSKSKWWEDLIEGMTMDLMEDICHQVLDLYSAQQTQKLEGKPVSPPPSAPRGQRQPPQAGPRDTPPPPPKDPPPQKRTKVESPADNMQTGNKIKKIKLEESSRHTTPAAKPAPSSKASSPSHKSGGVSNITVQHTQNRPVPISPYVSSNIYTSSFMSGEGQQSIQSLLGGGGSSTSAPPSQQYPSYPPPSTPTQYPPPPAAYTPGSYASGYSSGQYQTPTSYASYSGSGYNQGTPGTYASTAPPSATVLSPAYPAPLPSAYAAPPPNMPPPAQGYAPPYPQSIAQSSHSGQPPHFPPPGFGGPPSGYRGPPPIMSHRPQTARTAQRNLTPVRQINERGGMR